MTAKNHLIDLLPRKDRTALLAICEPVTLVLSETLYQLAEKTTHVYFPIDGYVSMLNLLDGASVLEVGMVGREGMLGVHVALGEVVSPLRAIVQGPGSSWRIPVRAFKAVLERSPALKLALNHYVSVRMAQLASSAACTRYHLIGPRLARWLLMSQDRAHNDHFHVTQEFMSDMLGVRRVGVTSAASLLQRHGLIEYQRGAMTVVDRKGLEAVACSCYATDRSAYDALVH